MALKQRQWAATVWLAACLAGCGADAPDPQPRPRLAAPQKEAIDAGPATVKVPLPVTEVDAVVAAWQRPEVQLLPGQWSQAQRQVRLALAEGRLYETAEDALPLLLAMDGLRPGDAWVKAQVAQVRRRLERDVDRLLAEQQHQRQALAAARQRLAVLQAIEEGEHLQARQQALVQAQQVLELNRRGEAALRAGRLGLDGAGALADFRQVLDLAPEDARAVQGVAAVESALLRQALAQARQGAFAPALRALELAAGVQGSSARQAEMRLRIEAERNRQVAALLHAGLHDLRTAAGLKNARERLQRMQAIARPGERRVRQLSRRIELATRYGQFAPGQAFRDRLADGSPGPQMIVIPAGQYMMGAEVGEPGAVEAEKPAHPVQFERGFAIAATEVTVGQFRRFVEQAPARPRATRRGHSMVYEPRTGNFIRRSGVDWQHGYEGAPARDDDPVMHVSVRDAEAYAAWLGEQTGQYYRLPSEAEFEYVLRAGTQGRYPWGNAATPPEQVGNLTGSEDVSATGRQWSNAFPGYGDGWWGVAPVARFSSNAWGVWDMEGNLSEWVGDCWHASYRRAPADGATWYNPGCRQRVVRGANWANAPVQARAAWRWQQESDVTSARIGFRVVRGL